MLVGNQMERSHVDHARVYARKAAPRAPWLSAWARCVLATACVCTGLLLSSAGSALALSQRGHAFAFSFGAVGAGDGQFKDPTSVAVNETTGDLYVSDTGNNRIEQFQPELNSGEEVVGYDFVSAWGIGVNGGKEFETCTSECRAGLKGGGFLHAPGQIAVDNSTNPKDTSKGDVYVVIDHPNEGSVVRKFSENGKSLGTLTKGAKATKELAESLEFIEGVAVDANGVVWVDGENNAIRAFEGDGTQLPTEPELELGSVLSEIAGPARGGLTAVAVNQGKHGQIEQDHLYVTYEPGGEGAIGSTACATKCATAEVNGLSVEEELAELEGGDAEATSEVLNPEVGGTVSTGAAADPVDDDVYVDSGTGLLALDASNGLVQSFGGAERGFTGLHGGGAVAVDHAAGAEVGDVATLEPSTGKVDVFKPSTAGSPAVDSAVAEEVGPNSATVLAAIDPGGATTGYHVIYSSTACTGSASECSGEAPVPPGSVEGFGDRQVSINLAGLAPSTTYQVQVLATNADGEARRELQLTTRTSAVESTLLDGRSWELVSPAESHGATIYGITKLGGLAQAADNGASIAYTSSGAEGENEVQGYRGPEPAQLYSTLHESRWSTEDIDTRYEAPSEGFEAGLPWEYEFFGSELQASIASPTSHVRLVPELRCSNGEVTREGSSEHDIYLREAAGGIFPIVNGCDDTAIIPENPGEVLTLPTERFNFEGATPNLSEVVIGSNTPLLKGVKGQGLYLWTRSTDSLQLISVLPTGKQAEGGVGASVGDIKNLGMGLTAISEHGLRIVWTSNSHIYVREIEHESEGKPVPPVTYQVDEVGGKSATEGEPEFQTASTDEEGEPAEEPTGARPYRVFFLDGPLTPGSTATAAHPDLYVFERTSEGSKVVDLSEGGREGAGVQGKILGANVKGTIVYFVANAALAPGAARGDCEAEEFSNGATCNLYVDRYDGQSKSWEKPRFIARLSAQDVGDWGEEEETSTRALSAQTARISPNGEYLAFMSEESLTGYDNEDVTSMAPGERRDEEVYLFRLGENGQQDQLTCVSCNPSGARPHGIFDQSNPVSPEGEGLLVDGAETWLSEGTPARSEPDHWLAGNIPGWTLVSPEEDKTWHQARYLSNEGRLFFNSADALVHLEQPTKIEQVEGRETEVGVENVYEYEPLGLGTCSEENTSHGCVALISSGESGQESEFVDASENGDDAYFITTSKLTANDPDTFYNLYDAHVCAEAVPCAPSPSGETKPCTGEGESYCRGGESPVVSVPAPASTTPGSGNTTARSGILGVTSGQPPAKPKPLTRAQLLARALKACKHDKSKKRRVACERQARKKYAPSAKKSAKRSGK
jgi:hypothetical protein